MTASRQTIGLVLAAGKGTRLKSDLPKVLHNLLGKPLLVRVIEALLPLQLKEIVVVVGHQAEAVETALADYARQAGWKTPLRFLLQQPQLGTGHAVMQLNNVLAKDEAVDVLITCGDMPLIPTQRYETLMSAYHNHTESMLAVATVQYADPTGYGRVFFDDHDYVHRIVEHKDANAVEQQQTWCNTGIYLGSWPTLSKTLEQLGDDNAQREYYLTDVVALMYKAGKPVQAVRWPDEEDVLGINSRLQLSQATSILSRRTAERLMEEGVSINQPDSSTFAPEVQVGPDTLIHPGCVLEGPVVVGQQCEIGPSTTMRGAITIHDHCRIVTAHLEKQVEVASHTYVGPYAHLRDNASIGPTCRIGNFVEVKEAVIGARSNAAHLCYLGDVDVGDDVNMGAGSIVANYDPVRDIKTRSTIETGVKVGCNSVLISPVTLHQDSSVAAGSVITDDVGSGELAIARCRQSTIEGWVDKAKNTTKTTASGKPKQPAS
ncbi:MAG: bifunctional UDP-N-acetylglucosamine diphosphorylase/glucosamine-1-phosphate N-acetyltransferase GlmU [Cyanobacteria bacterium HKST-UBA05]|nr:bifunctional UDP-N-acetylglucosamine diphosphorylase/glucosamine-1-phosphate N-acetyltransferase GlmU [Cyanobacteria bacterium HKST-UBA05]